MVFAIFAALIALMASVENSTIVDAVTVNAVPINAVPINNATDNPDIRAILAEIYQEMGGAYWRNATGWMTNASYCEWFGVTCNEVHAVTHLELYDNNVTGRVPRGFRGLVELEYIDLRENPIEGYMDDIIAPRLKYVGVSRSLITEYYTSHAAFVYLRTLDIENNKFLTGEIPPWPPTCVQIFLDGNILTGSIPPFVQGIFYQTIYLQGNRLNGILTPEHMNANIDMINLSHNFLTGTIPPINGDLIYDINLSYNRFTGPLRFSGTDKIESIQVAHNQLTGRISQRVFWPGSNINLIDISHNQFTGDGPDTINSFATVLLFNNNNFTGGLHHPGAASYFDISGNPLMRAKSMKYYVPVTDGYHQTIVNGRTCPFIRHIGGTTDNVVVVSPEFYNYTLCV